MDVVPPHLEVISFRPLGRADFPVLEQWLARPHVVEWWREALGLPELEGKYGRRIDGLEPVHVYMIGYGERVIGFIQWYRWSDYPDHAAALGASPDSAGIDLAIGEPDLIGIGMGTAVIDAFVRQVVFSDPSIAAVYTDVEIGNLRSLGAFRNSGFSEVKTVQLAGESYQRCVLRIGRDQAVMIASTVVR